MARHGVGGASACSSPAQPDLVPSRRTLGDASVQARGDEVGEAAVQAERRRRRPREASAREERRRRPGDAATHTGGEVEGMAPVQAGGEEEEAGRCHYVGRQKDNEAGAGARGAPMSV